MNAVAIRLGLRMLRRDIAAGEIRVLLAALVLAVCAVSSVGFVTDRAGRALGMEANRLLGGDAVLRADAPFGEKALQEAQRLGLQTAETRGFPSMIRVKDSLKLSDIRALGTGFPLRGNFTLNRSADEPPVPASGVPETGTLWLSRAGAQSLGAVLGDEVVVGERTLQLVALVVQEPDAALDYFNVAPKAFINLEDLPSTGLIQLGSRVSYRLVVAGDASAVEAWTTSMKADLARGQRLESIQDARPEVRSALARADQFLGLAALVSVVLAGIAVAMAARRHAAHHLDGCAVMRCLGAEQKLVLAIHAGELLWLGLLGSVLGLVLGWTLQYVLGLWLADTLGLVIPAAGWMPAVHGIGVGFCVLLAFALPPILALRRVSAARVLRREAGGLEAGAVASTVAGLAGLTALLWWKAGSVSLGGVVLLGILATLAVLALLALALIALLRHLRGRLRGPWRYGLANVSRRAGASVVQISALGLGLMAILLLTLVRTDLISRWQDSLPVDAPNRFLINIQPDQLTPVREHLIAAGVIAPQLHPMVRARLVAVNDVPVTAATFTERGPRAVRMAEREFNLSSVASLREDDNRVTAGHFWTAADAEPTAAEPEISVEQSMAELLGWKVGDHVRFDVAGSVLDARITSLRHVDWESFNPNFFVLVSPAGLANLPASHVSAIHVPASNQSVTDDLVRKFPNVSVIDIEAVLAQVRNTADQVATAVEYVFYFTLVAGLLVLVAAVSATQDERLLEGGVMRVLGASSRQLRMAQLTEFASIGLIAGATAAIAAAIISGVIARQVFELPWQPDWRLALFGAGAGMLAVAATGLWATWRVARVAPSVTLREL
ncbi:MAG: ABC transporter permease [Pseudomarimonas sp.]